MAKISKVDIIASQAKLQDLIDELNKIGITGITVTNVLGCGVQKGYKEFYRGKAVNVNLLPKVKVEAVVCDVPVADVVATAKKVLHTGKIGDGKIFVYDVENVVRVSSGEEGRDALQYNK